jgi:hypothetical protein
MLLYSTIPKICREIKKEVKVALTGEARDEMCSGIPLDKYTNRLFSIVLLLNWV